MWCNWRPQHRRRLRHRLGHRLNRPQGSDVRFARVGRFVPLFVALSSIMLTIDLVEDLGVPVADCMKSILVF
jgi:hypothetical protein